MVIPYSSKRSFTGHHTLFPASEIDVLVPIVANRNFISWTFGRGTVIYRIWPAVSLHTIFAALVVYVSLKTNYNLAFPPVLLTVLGLVLGFVISYRASSGYDRYWMGRSCWSDITCTARSFSRLIWFHVPLRLTVKSEGVVEETDDIHAVMAEKHLALDLVEAFAVALKHHLRGEGGIYYEDLYPLVQPFLSCHAPRHKDRENGRSPTLQPHSNPAASSSSLLTKRSSMAGGVDPVIPPINAYGTFDVSGGTSSPHTLVHKHSKRSFTSSHGEHTILPSAIPTKDTILSDVSVELVPFGGFFSSIELSIKWLFGFEGSELRTHKKHRPLVAGGGENLPLDLLRSLTEWLAVLEMRETAGTSLGGMQGCIASFENSLSALEKILTTPLPIVFSAHIRQTVWLYLLFLPFQLVDQFKWYTIPGVSAASFIYLGFLAAGEEIEQPFGYDQNDLDLDLFCHEIVHADIERLKGTPCTNAHVDSRYSHHSMISIVTTRENMQLS